MKRSTRVNPNKPAATLPRSKDGLIHVQLVPRVYDPSTGQCRVLRGQTVTTKVRTEKDLEILLKEIKEIM
jgi:hypothetical protein